MEGQGFSSLHSSQQGEQTSVLLPLTPVSGIFPSVQVVSSFWGASPAIPVQVINPGTITHYLPQTSQSPMINQNPAAFATNSPQMSSDGGPLKLWCAQNRIDGRVQRYYDVNLQPSSTAPLSPLVHHSYLEGLSSDSCTLSRSMSFFNDLNSSSSTSSISHPSIDTTPISMFEGTPHSTIAWSCQKQSSLRSCTSNISIESSVHNKSAKKQLFSSAAATKGDGNKNVFDIFQQELRMQSDFTDSDCFIISPDSKGKHLTSTPVSTKVIATTLSKTPLKCKEENITVDVGMKLPVVSTPGNKIEINVTPVLRPSLTKAPCLNMTNSGYLLPDDCIDLTNDIKEEELLGCSKENQTTCKKHDVSVQVDLIEQYQANKESFVLHDHNYLCSSEMTTKSVSEQKKGTCSENINQSSAFISPDKNTTFDIHDSPYPPEAGNDTILNTKRIHCCNDSDTTVEYTTGYYSNSAGDSVSPWQQHSYAPVRNTGVKRSQKDEKNTVTPECRNVSSLADIQVHVDPSKIMSRHFVPISTHAATPTKPVWPVAKSVDNRYCTLPGKHLLEGNKDEDKSVSYIKCDLLEYKSCTASKNGMDDNECDASVLGRSLLQLAPNTNVQPGSNCSESPLDISSTRVTDKASYNSFCEEPDSGLTLTPSTEQSAVKKPKHSGDKALEKLLDEAVGINGMKKRTTPRCLKCHRWFRSDSLLAEHYQFHNIIRTRRGHLTLYGSGHYVHRHSSNSNSPTSSGTECFTCTPPVTIRRNRKYSCSTPVSRFKSVRSAPYNLRYTPNTSTDSEKLNSGCKKRKLNFKKPGRPKKSKERNSSFEPSSSNSEVSRVLRLRKRIVEVLEGQKSYRPFVKSSVNVKSSAKKQKIQQPSKPNKVTHRHDSLLKTRLSRIPLRYTAKLSPKFICKGKLSSKKTSFRCRPKLSPTKKVTQCTRNIFGAKPVISKIPVPLSKKANRIRQKVLLSKAGKCASKNVLSTNECKKLAGNHKSAQSEQLPSMSKCKEENGIRQSVDKIVTIKHRGHKTATEKVIQPVEKKFSTSDLCDLDRTIDYIPDELASETTDAYTLRKATVAQRVKALSRKQIKSVLNNNDDCKMIKVSACKRTFRIKEQNSKISVVESKSEKKCSKVNDKNCDISAVNSKDLKGKTHAFKSKIEPDINNNVPNKNVNEMSQQSPIMPLVDKSYVKDNDEDLDFEAALLEMKLVNDGLPPFTVDDKYIDNLKLKTRGKSIDITGENNKQKSKKKKLTHIRKEKVLYAKNNKTTNSKSSAGSAIPTSGSVILSTNKNTSDQSVPGKFKLVWNKKERPVSSQIKGNLQSESCKETVGSCNSEQNVKQIGKTVGKQQHDPLAHVKCKYCDDVMPRKELPGHRLLQHRYSCNVCKNRFATKEEQLAHEKTHGVFHECQLCERKFYNISAFKRHLNSQEHLRLEKVQRYTMDYMYQKFMTEKGPSQQASFDHQQSHLVAAENEDIAAACGSTDSHVALTAASTSCDDRYPLDFTINDGFLNELGINNPDQCEGRIDLPWLVTAPETTPPDDVYVSSVSDKLQSSCNFSDQVFDSGIGSSGEPSFNISSGIRTALNLVDLFVGDDDYVSF